MEQLKDRIRYILDLRELRQVDFARALGISANYVYLLTSGRKTVISETLARLIANTYHVSYTWIMTGHGSPDTLGDNFTFDKKPESTGITSTRRELWDTIHELSPEQLALVSDFLKILNPKPIK